jgi:quinol-cytochrome oxidoreductase complex cytochrome b subunit
MSDPGIGREAATVGDAPSAVDVSARDMPPPTPRGSSGVLAAVLLVAACVTGLLLMTVYRPLPELAAAGLFDLHQTSLLAYVQKLHVWLSHGLVAVVWLHLLSVAVRGAYRPPRHRDWLVGLLLLVSILALAVSGDLLPWDASARRLAAALGLAADDDATLVRIYTLHCAVLPLLVGGLAAWHWRRARRRSSETPGSVAGEDR